MKKLYALLLVALASLQAKLDYRQMSEVCSIPLDEIPRVMEQLQEWERGCDEDWQVYYHLLPGLINKYALKVGVEVGIFMGSHCKRILETTNVVKLIGVDPYMPGNSDDMKISHYDLFFNYVKDKLSPFGERFTLLRNFSVFAAKEFKNHSLDFVFIDGDHSYEAVRADLEGWYDKVRAGGIVAGDDYATRHPGVPRAVNEFFAKKGLKINISSEQPRFWWVVKP